MFYSMQLTAGFKLIRLNSLKVAYTSGPFFEKMMKRNPIFSLQINYYQIDERHE